MKYSHTIASCPALLPALLLALVFLPGSTPAEHAMSPPAGKLGAFELKDQYEQLHAVSFPGTNIMVMAVADQQGSKQVDGWIAPVKQRYAARIEITGLADMGGLPSVFRGLARSKFKKQCSYPVMLDWNGEVARGIGYETDKVSILVIHRDGTVLLHLSGAADDAGLRRLYETIDRALAPPGR